MVGSKKKKRGGDFENHLPPLKKSPFSLRHQPLLNSELDQLRARVEIQFSKDVFAVRFDGVLADEQRFADTLAAQAPAD